MPINSKSSTAQAAFNKLIAWLSLLGVVLTATSSIWTYYNTNQLILITQERRELALGKGLALAISDLIVTREYAELESDLQQIMGNEAVKSVMVTDLRGVVLAYLGRKTISGPVTPDFKASSVNIPQVADRFLVKKEGDLSILWYRVDPGIPLGWIRMETFLKLDDAILNNLRLNILLSVFVLFLGIFGITLMFFFKVKRKTEEEELRLKNSNAMLEDIAHHDALTKLPNRLSLNELLENALATAKAKSELLAICFLDLDGFKGVNDQLGHRSGDNLLIAASGRMKKAIRERDSVIRLGGDEFILLLGGINSRNQLEILLNRILELLAAPFMIDGQSVAISASCGVTIFPDDDAPMTDLLTHADTAMYAAKSKGKNTWEIYTPQALDKNHLFRP